MKSEIIAIIEIIEVLKNAMVEAEVGEIIGNEAQVLKRFNPVCQVGPLDLRDQTP
ncbi:MAG: hypothetical protein ACI8R4_001260 [Paracoccaceae bacterium]|jgi:hypothetical protein